MTKIESCSHSPLKLVIYVLLILSINICRLIVGLFLNKSFHKFLASYGGVILRVMACDKVAVLLEVYILAVSISVS